MHGQCMFSFCAVRGRKHFAAEVRGISRSECARGDYLHGINSEERPMNVRRLFCLVLLCGVGGIACEQPMAPNLITNGEECLRRIGIGATAPGAAREFLGCAGYEERFLLAIPPRCTTGGCGLIADVPGATAPAENPNLNTGLRERTRDLPQPFLVLGVDRPSRTFNQASSNRIFMFMQAIANVFNVDRDR